LVASSFTIPMDVLKSNIMASSGSSSMRSMAANLFRTVSATLPHSQALNLPLTHSPFSRAMDS
jgi:hypothetical protein